MKMCHNKVKKKHFSVKLFFIDMPLKGMLHCLHVIEGNFYIVKSAKICKLYLKTHSLICFIYQYLIPRLFKKKSLFMIILCKILLCQSLTHITYQDSFMLLYISVVKIYLFAHTDISVSDLCGCNH